MIGEASYDYQRYHSHSLRWLLHTATQLFSDEGKLPNNADGSAALSCERDKHR